MLIWLALSRFLTVLAVVSLVSGVFAGPGKAGPMDNMAAAMMSADTDMVPCGQPQLPDCGDMLACPFGVACVAKCPQSLPAVASIRRDLPSITAVAPRNDLQGSSLTSSPLEHPPKA
jgi:hypothetical protein